jgi:hypothetical protein
VAKNCKSLISLTDVYSTLSAHVHGQSSLTLPHGDALAEIVCSKPRLDELPDLQRQVAEALGNYFVALFAPDWPDLPARSVLRVNSALSDKRRVFFVPTP